MLPVHCYCCLLKRLKLWLMMLMLHSSEAGKER